MLGFAGCRLNRRQVWRDARKFRQQLGDLVELNRVNRLLITFDRSARAMGKAQGAERNPEEQQRLVTARTAIKTRMRTAIAGQQVQAMRHEVQNISLHPCQ